MAHENGAHACLSLKSAAQHLNGRDFREVNVA